jgi:hypothetical protein
MSLMSLQTTCVVVLGAAAIFVTREVSAQDAPAPSASATPPPPAPAAPAPAAAPAKVEDGTPDHERVVGRFGVGFFGLRELPFAGGDPNALTKRTVDAPVIGARYWFQQNLGIDAGIGFASVTGSSEAVQGNNTVNLDHPSQLGFAFHLGVPIALSHHKHYSFLLIPEADLGFTSGTQKFNGANPAPDINYSGFLFDIGARVGAEIHFGFIGIPELALEGGIGLYFRRATYKAKQDPNSASDGTNTFGTAVPLTNPWGLFLNQVNAIYYF